MGFAIDVDPRVTGRPRIAATAEAPEQRFSAVFRVMPVSEFERHDLATGAGARAFLVAAIVSLDDVQDAAGNALSFDDALRDRVIDQPLARAALVRAYVEAVEEAARGN